MRGRGRPHLEIGSGALRVKVAVGVLGVMEGARLLLLVLWCCLFEGKRGKERRGGKRESGAGSIPPTSVDTNERSFEGPPRGQRFDWMDHWAG